MFLVDRRKLERRKKSKVCVRKFDVPWKVGPEVSNSRLALEMCLPVSIETNEWWGYVSWVSIEISEWQDCNDWFPKIIKGVNNVGTNIYNSIEISKWQVCTPTFARRNKWHGCLNCWCFKWIESRQVFSHCWDSLWINE